MTTAILPEKNNESDLLRTADGVLLKTALSRVSRRSKIKAFLLVLPLFAFIMISFVVPIGQMLFRSVNNDSFYSNMPLMTVWFENNTISTVPDESAFAALAADLAVAKKDRTIGQVATRLNYEVAGSRSLFTSTARDVKKFKAPFKEI